MTDVSQTAEAEALLRAKLDQARGASDLSLEREVCIELAKLLASQGTELREAAAFAERALTLADDSDLRLQLAGWLSVLGEPAHAAAVLSGLCSSDKPEASANFLLKVGVLLARAQDPGGALDALRQAMNWNTKDPRPCELWGTIAFATTYAVPSALAARTYLEAAHRRHLMGQREAAFENRLRAFEMAPENASAVVELASDLRLKGRVFAADEIERRHAEALLVVDAERARAVHEERVRAAISEGDYVRAMAAVIDGRFDEEISGHIAQLVDDVFSVLGFDELLCLRWETRARTRSLPEERAELFARLARLCEERLGLPEQALEYWAEVLAVQPSDEQALEHVRKGSTYDPWMLADALLRVAALQHDRRQAVLEELLSLAEEKLRDPGLAHFAHSELQQAFESPLGAIEQTKLATRLRHQDNLLEEVEQEYQGTESAEAKCAALRKLAPILQGRPHRQHDYARVLHELSQAFPQERGYLTSFGKVAERAGFAAEYEALLKQRLSQPLSRFDLVRARLRLSSMQQVRGNAQGALDEVSPLLLQAPGHRAGVSAVLFHATLAHDNRYRALSLAQLAGSTDGALRAVLLSSAALLMHRIRLHDVASAQDAPGHWAEQAVEADPTCARAVSVLALIRGDALEPAFFERAMGTALATSELCDVATQVYRRAGQPWLALAWARRWVSIKPGDSSALISLLELLRAERDPERLKESLLWVLGQPRPLEHFAEAIVQALFALVELDSTMGLDVARSVLDVLGPREANVRNVLLQISDARHDDALAISVLERWLAVASVHDDTRAAALELAARRLRLGLPVPLFSESKRRYRHGTHETSETLLQRIREEEARDAALQATDRVRTENRARRATELLEAAETLMRTQGSREEIFALASAALELVPSSTKALQLLEQHAGPLEDEHLSAAYDRIAKAAYGVFGRRSAHYRAMRTFERKENFSKALVHASAMFEVLPFDTRAYELMAALAKNTNDASDISLVVSSVEQMALRATGSERALWLDRAASLIPRSLQGCLQQSDILVRALVAAPAEETLQRAKAAITEVAVFEGDQGTEALEASARLMRALRSALANVAGPNGARFAIAVVKLALVDISRAASEGTQSELASELDTSLAELAFQRATELDASVDEFAGLFEPFKLVQTPLRERFAALAEATFKKPYSVAGSGLRKALSALSGNGGADIQPSEPANLDASSAKKEAGGTSFDASWFEDDSDTRDISAEATVMYSDSHLRDIESSSDAYAKACDEQANSPDLAPDQRAEVLLAAALAYEKIGNVEVALHRAEAARECAPSAADICLEAFRLRYRLRGIDAKNPNETRRVIEQLERIVDDLPQAALELHTFLMAEHLDAIYGPEAGIRELTRRHAELGSLPLIALGMAERFSQNRRSLLAIPFYEAALAGNLRGLREPSDVARSAAKVALRAGQPDKARRFLESADPPIGVNELERMRAELVQQGDADPPR